MLSILLATGACGAVVLPVVAVVLPKVVSILPIGLVVHACDVVVVFDNAVVGPRGLEVPIAVVVAALYGAVVDSDSAVVDAYRPVVGSEVPVAHASDVDNRPVAVDNGFGGRSIQVVARNSLVGVASVQPESPDDDLWEVAVRSGARANDPGTGGA